MEPVNTIVNAPNNRSCCQKTKVACMYIPVVILGGFSIVGIGMAFANGFSGAISLTNLTTISNIALANIAFSGTIAIGSLAVCSCYLYIVPKKLFQEDIEDQKEANIEMQSTVKGVDHTIVNFHDENTKLQNNLNENEKSFNILKIELDHKTEQLLLLSEQLKMTLKELTDIKDDFTKADTTICNAKLLIISMIEMSKKIKLNIKSSKVALNLFKDCNQNLGSQLKEINLENHELSNLLSGYSKIISEEHTQFDILIKASEILNETCESLKKEISGLSADSLKISDDVEKDVKTTIKLEFLEKQLENLNNQLK